MTTKKSCTDLPYLPQNATPEQRISRNFQLALARTNYNYMFSYLEPVPFSANVPKGENFSVDYEVKVLQAFSELAENFKMAVDAILKREVDGDLALPVKTLGEIKQAFAKLETDWSPLHPIQNIENLRAVFDSLGKLPEALESLAKVPADLAKMATGLDDVLEQTAKDGPTALLKSTLDDMLSISTGHDYRLATKVEEYLDLFKTLPAPLMLQIKQQDWMRGTERPCEQDWFFGHLQIAGFNTTLLCGVTPHAEEGKKTVGLDLLLQKMPMTDALFQAVIGDAGITLRQAAQQNRLFVCDYASLKDGQNSTEVDEAGLPNCAVRYMSVPIALFYWNPTPPPGYPTGQPGVMQPIAIQLAQQYDVENAPIFTPNDQSGANDSSGFKWKIAKYIVNAMQAIQHESVAHLGACHFTIEPVVVASRRQLAEAHPLLQLLIPHFRFTIQINESARTSLIIPGGVVATNVGPSIASTLTLVGQAREAWRWDENNPERLFEQRGVATLPVFPFRDDTMLLWQATKKFVADYLALYYSSDVAVQQDTELQAWVNELVSPLYGCFKGMHGLTQTGDAKNPVQLDSLAYLTEIVTYIIYLAGPQHASVNYAQYPLMSFTPSVAGTVYQPAPKRSTVLQSDADCLPWYSPLDVSLYTFSFEYLLSAIQYDTFGHYPGTAYAPYFKDARVQEVVADFQGRLAAIEAEIRTRNKTRPMPYPFQLPSLIPNSISI